jgi:DNA polymerase phi
MFDESSSRKNPSTKKRKVESEEETPEPVEVLADILISFLAKPSAVMRNLSSDVFGVFSTKCTKRVLDIMFEVYR